MQHDEVNSPVKPVTDSTVLFVIDSMDISVANPSVVSAVESLVVTLITTSVEMSSVESVAIVTSVIVVD